MRFLRHKMYWLTVHQVLMVLTIVIAAVGALGSLAGSGDVRCLCGVFRAWLCRMSELHVACHAAGAHHHARHHGVGAGERGRVVGSPGLRDQVLPQQALPAYSIRVRVVSMGVLNVSLYSLVCMYSRHACVCIRGCACWGHVLHPINAAGYTAVFTKCWAIVQPCWLALACTLVLV